MRGLDIGCGANLIYPLLGAAMNGWSFVAADVTEVADRGARRNREANPQLAPLLEVRLVAPPLHGLPLKTSEKSLHGLPLDTSESEAGAALPVAVARGGKTRMPQVWYLTPDPVLP